MREATLVGAAVVALALGPLGHATAQDAGMADVGDLTLETGQDLVDLCSVGPEDDLSQDAMMFCLGAIEGMIQYHDALGRGPDGDLVVCPAGGDKVTRGDLVEIFVTWGEANPDQASTVWPAEAVVLAALDTWGPCDTR